MAAHRRSWILGLVVLVLAGAIAGLVGIHETWFNDFSSLSHYEALGVSPTATAPEIKRAFRELSLRYHPDKAASELNVRRFHRISEAAQVLGNEDTRRAYDEQLEVERRVRAHDHELAWRRIRFAPPRGSTVADALWFYLGEFPSHVLALARLLVSPRLLITALVGLGSAIFVLDLLLRLVVGPLVVAFGGRGARGPAVTKEYKDVALLAARARQQEALDARSAERRPLRHRRHHPASTTTAVVGTALVTS